MTARRDKDKIRPIRTYEIAVDGYTPILYSARSPAKARWRAFVDYGVVSTCNFGEFLATSRCRRVDDPPEVGQRIVVFGKAARRVIGRGNAFMYDDGDAILTAHDLDVQSANCVPCGAALDDQHLASCQRQGTVTLESIVPYKRRAS